MPHGSALALDHVSRQQEFAANESVVLEPRASALHGALAPTDDRSDTSVTLPVVGGGDGGEVAADVRDRRRVAELEQRANHGVACLGRWRREPRAAQLLALPLARSLVRTLDETFERFPPVDADADDVIRPTVLPPRPCIGASVTVLV